MRKLFVGNLQWETTEDDLQMAFDAAGFPVERSRLIKDSDTGKAKGYGFVDLVRDADIEVVKDKMSGCTIRGRVIGVEEAKRSTPGKQ